MFTSRELKKIDKLTVNLIKISFKLDRNYEFVRVSIIQNVCDLHTQTRTHLHGHHFESMNINIQYFRFEIKHFGIFRSIL